MNTHSTDTTADAGQNRAKIKAVPKDSLIYNAVEKKEHASGFMGEGKPTATCMYSVWSIGTEKAQWQARNAWGQILSGEIPVDHIESYEPKEIR